MDYSEQKFLYTFHDLILTLDNAKGSVNFSADDVQKCFDSSAFDSSAPSSSSAFDQRLSRLWENAMRNGLFRYTLFKNDLPFKLLPGKFNYIAQLNPDRAQKRRQPQEIQSVNQPFNPSEFNFNKIDPKEIILKIQPWHSSAELAEDHSILINVSPLEYCHVLLTPFRNQCRPQTLTEKSLRLALELCLLSHSSDFRVGFNSLCGYASVNHEHYHAYFLSHRLFIEYVPLIKVPANVGNSPFFQLEDPDYPPGFCLVLTDLRDSSMDACLKSVMLLATYFQSNNIGHNLYITRGSTKNIKGHFDSVRVYVWARKSSFGAKECDAFNPALCELAGHFPIKNEDAYKTLNEEFILKELHEICDEPFKKVRDWIALKP